MSSNESLSDAAGEGHFHVLCELSEIQNRVSSAIWEYVTSDGRVDSMRVPLNDAERAIKNLLELVGGASGGGEG